MLTTLRARFDAWLGDASLKRIAKNASLLFSAESVTMLIGLVQFPPLLDQQGTLNLAGFSIWIHRCASALKGPGWIRRAWFRTAFRQEQTTAIALCRCPPTPARST